MFLSSQISKVIIVVYIARKPDLTYYLLRKIPVPSQEQNSCCFLTFVLNNIFPPIFKKFTKDIRLTDFSQYIILYLFSKYYRLANQINITLRTISNSNFERYFYEKKQFKHYNLKKKSCCLRFYFSEIQVSNLPFVV